MGTIKEKLDKMLASKNAIKAAIIEKGQAVEDVLSSYPAAIKAIKTGTDTSDATAEAGDILSGKIAYGASGKLIGTIPSKGSEDLSASGANIIVPAGYYPSQVQKSVVTANQATPTISVSSGGLITASATQGEGYVAAGTKSATKQLTTQAAKTITPGTTQQTAVASGRYTTGAVTVKGDANLAAANIKKGVSIFGVAGSYEGTKPIFYTVSLSNVSVENNSFSITLPSNYRLISSDPRESFPCITVQGRGHYETYETQNISFGCIPIDITTASLPRIYGKITTYYGGYGGDIQFNVIPNENVINFKNPFPSNTDMFIDSIRYLNFSALVITV